MGCDIHGYLEVVIKDSADTLHSIPTDRNYDWFGILADVRNYANQKPIDTPRGLPENVDLWAASDSNEPGHFHSHSWLSLRDFKEHDWDFEAINGRLSTVDKTTGEEKGKAVYTWLQDNPEEVAKRNVELKHLTRKAKELIPYRWQCFIEYMGILAQKYGDENVRVVFWFDN